MNQCRDGTAMNSSCRTTLPLAEKTKRVMTECVWTNF